MKSYRDQLFYSNMIQAIAIKKIVDIDVRDRVNILLREKVEHVYSVIGFVTEQLWSEEIIK